MTKTTTASKTRSKKLDLRKETLKDLGVRGTVKGGTQISYRPTEGSIRQTETTGIAINPVLQKRGLQN